jgi:hypothetical protein
VLAHDRRWNPFERGRKLCPQLSVEAEDLSGAHHLHEQPSDDLVIHRRAHRQDADLAVRQSIAILRRH